jgi:iron complex transport system substrate-binding protein
MEIGSAFERRKRSMANIKSTYRTIFICFCIYMTSISFLRVSEAREITDMMGRKVTILDTIKKVYAPSPYGSYALYSIDPSLVCGLIFPIKDEDKKFVNPALRDLPVIGSLSGQGQTTNIEVLVKAKPDLLIMWSAKKSAMDNKAEELLKKLNIPYVYAVAESLYDYPEVYRFLGNVLNRQEKSDKLAAYIQKTLTNAKAAVDRVPVAKRSSVFYAEGVDGLSTECNDSIHVELLKIAGDRDVHRCHTASHMGMEKVSLEQVMMYAPDIIVAQENAFYDSVMKDPGWQNVKAVKDGKVYLIPRAPYNWFDRPPSFMRIMGLNWLMIRMYPSEYKIDIIKEARDFYKLFLGVDFTNEEMKKVIQP